jgi:hypothetical protein
MKWRLLVVAAVLAVVGIPIVAVGATGHPGIGPPVTTTTVPRENPASHAPGFPGNHGNTPYPRDANAAGPCGVPWRDVYVADDATIEVSIGNDNQCHVWTKAERAQQQPAPDDTPGIAPPWTAPAERQP